MTWVLKDRRVTKRSSRVKNSITHFHGFVEFETPHPESWRSVVAQKERTLEATVVEDCVFHELTFSRKMPNAVAAESMQISIQVSCELTCRADAFPRCDAICLGPPPEDSTEMLQSKWSQASRDICAEEYTAQVFFCDPHIAFAFRTESMIVIYSRAQYSALNFGP